MGDGHGRGSILHVLAGASSGGDRGLRTEAGDTKRLPSVPEVADDPVLGQLPSEAPSVLRDHIHPAKAGHQIVFSFLFITIVLYMFAMCLAADCQIMQETACEKKYNICAKA